MKKHILILVFALTGFVLQAQDLVTITGYRSDESSIDLVVPGNSIQPGIPMKISTGNEDILMWTFEETNDGYYYIINSTSKLYMEPSFNPPVSGSSVVQKPPRGSENQKWTVIPAGKDMVYILPKLNDNLYLTVTGANVRLSFYSSLSDVIQTWDIYCFPEDALVTVEGQKQIPIQNVRKGMKLLSVDPKTKLTEFSSVAELIEHNGGTYWLTRITFVNNDQLLASTDNGIYLQQIEATNNHPLLTNKGYKPVGLLNENDTILYYSSLENKVKECIIVSVEKNIRSVDKVYNIKLENANSFIVNSVMASPKCPFVSVKNGNEFVEISEILRNQMSRLLERNDRIVIPLTTINNSEITIRIDERKDEISFIDRVYLMIDGKIIEPEIGGNSALINDEDMNYLVLKKGESVELKFHIPADITPQEIYINAKGYYESLKPK
jgi:hypothetical protein